MSVVFFIRLFKWGLKFSDLFRQTRNFFSGFLLELFVLLLLIVSILLAISELSSYSIQLISKFLDNSPLLLSMKISFSFSPIKLILSWLKFAFQRVDVLVELIDSIMIGFAISLKSVGKRVDPPTLLLTFLSSFIRLNIKLVLEGIDLSSKG